MRYAKIPDDGPGGGLDLGDSDLDSEDEREKKLLQLQEQLRQMQEQMRILVEESMRSKKRKNKFAPATPGKRVKHVWQNLDTKLPLELIHLPTSLNKKTDKIDECDHLYTNSQAN